MTFNFHTLSGIPRLQRSDGPALRKLWLNSDQRQGFLNAFFEIITRLTESEIDAVSRDDLTVFISRLKTFGLLKGVKPTEFSESILRTGQSRAVKAALLGLMPETYLPTDAVIQHIESHAKTQAKAHTALDQTADVLTVPTGAAKMSVIFANALLPDAEKKPLGAVEVAWAAAMLREAALEKSPRQWWEGSPSMNKLGTFESGWLEDDAMVSVWEDVFVRGPGSDFSAGLVKVTDNSH